MPTKEVAKRPQTKSATLRSMLEHSRVLKSLNEICGKALDPKRLIDIVFQAATRTPKLLECTPESIVHCLMQSAQLGLELASPLQHAHLVPFRNSKTGKMDAIFMPGYRGIVHLVRKSDLNVTNIEARLVYTNDIFDLTYGFEPILSHRPCLDSDRGSIRGAYMMVKFADGREPHVEWMTLQDIEAVATKAKSKEGPWKDEQARPEMMRKTVLKRGLKVLPLSSIVAEVIERDNRLETEGPQAIDFEIVDPITGEMQDSEEPKTGMAGAAAALNVKTKATDETAEQSEQTTKNGESAQAEKPKLSPEEKAAIIEQHNNVYNLLEKRFPNRAGGKNPQTLRREWTKKEGGRVYLQDIEDIELLKEMTDKLTIEIDENKNGRRDS